MNYELSELKSALSADPKGVIAQSEAAYRSQLEAVAEAVDQNRQQSPVVLLAGPSGSSKTTTGTRLQETLQARGLDAHLISMDNYYVSWEHPDFPMTQDGQRDLESPQCLDIPLLDEHFGALEQGEAIYVPIYDFPSHRRLEGRSMRLAAGDVFIFEGIHALNPLFTGRHPGAYRLFVSPTAGFSHNGAEICPPQLLRLMRRVVRDFQFRGASAEFSLQLWGNVVASEQIYIAPYREEANGEVNTTLAYELGVLGPYVRPLFQSLGPEVPCREAVDACLRVLEQVEPLPDRLVPQDSILREFIGLSGPKSSN